MKKVVLLGLLIATFSFNGQSQVYKHSLGLRTNSFSLARGTFLQYQLGLNSSTRLDFGLNFFHRGINNPNFSRTWLQTSVYYQKVWNIKGGLNWYAGAGIQYQLINASYNSFPFNTHVLSAGPQVGIEYDFNKHNVPLIFGIDYSPNIAIGSNSQGVFLRNSFNMSLRYTFNSNSATKRKKID